ncbi:MAG: CBS domain-containing protein [Candidatus Nitrosotenuis sp.]|nr:MAG: CBS domain-containing protein [Candidatus Nitrosotenuis sp.]
MPNIKSITKKPISIPKESTVAQAVRQILQHNVSHLMVSNEGDLVGIVTQKDLGFFLLSDNTEDNLDKIPLAKVMKPLVTVDESMKIKEGAQIMIDRKIGSLGINSHGKTVGIITKTDLIRHYLQKYVGKKRVGDFMTVSYVSMYEDDPIHKIAAKMVKEKVSRIILKSQADAITGIVTFKDLFILAMTLGREGRTVDNTDPAISVISTRKGFLSESGFGKTILSKEVMSSQLVTADYNDDLITACEIILDNNVNGVGVLVNGKLSGILSKTDIVRALVSV